ncbi:leucine-rich repeat domain-containing protein [bacterium]|nr:leucine-rich repeat domain-containing protein [bacterium]
MVLYFWSCTDTGPMGDGNGNGDPCDPFAPVILNGDTIPFYRVTRDDYGCVVAIDISEMDLYSSNCLYGIDDVANTLEALYVNNNHLSYIDLYYLRNCYELEQLDLANNELYNIDLYPLSFCDNLRWLYLESNYLTSIDLEPIWSLYSLEALWLTSNNLDTTSCAYVCQFVDDRPDCQVLHDCWCR